MSNITFHGEALGPFFKAFSTLQGQIENAMKNAQNPHLRNRYADIASILDAARPVLSANGMCLIQSGPRFSDGFVYVTSVIGHESGVYAECTASCAVAKPDAQTIGAAETYLRRYSAAPLLGISQEDDDGNQASAGVNARRQVQLRPEAGTQGR